MKFPLRTVSILLAVACTGAGEPATPLPQKPSDLPPASIRAEAPRGGGPQIMTADLKAAADLAQAGRLMDADHLTAGLKQPTHEKIALCAPSQSRLSGREIAERARASYVRMGWYYHCSECGNWHLNMAGGYAIAANTVVTAYHVLEAPAKMKNAEGFLIAIRNDSEVIPVVAIVAADKDTDAAILRLGVSNLAPLALSDDERIGDTVFCLSDPRGIRGYFSSGIINRYFSIKPAAGADARFRRVNVSTDWAPGSSGAAILDECGNVAGHVARISSIFNDPHAPGVADRADRADRADSAGARPATLMNLHEAVPAKSVLAVIKN